MVLAVLALVVLGPNRLPGAARTLGRLVGQLRSMSSSLQSEVREALHEPHEAFTSAISEFGPVTELRRGGVRRVVTDTLIPRGLAPGGLQATSGKAPTPSGPDPATGPNPATGGGIPDDPAFN